MNIYKASNLIISPKRKVYRKERGAGALNDESIYKHTHTLSLSLSLSLSPPPPTYTHTSITVSGREGYWDGKRCVFRADLKAKCTVEMTK